MSKEVANKFVEALWKLEQERDVEALVQIHTENCDVGNVAVPRTFSGHDGLREFWTSYRDTFGDMKANPATSSPTKPATPPWNGTPQARPTATKSPTKA